MKPCSKKRKSIAWLVLNELDDQKVAELRDHLAHCEGCRHYSEEISNLTKGLGPVASGSDLEASESFHRRVTAQLVAVQSESVLANFAVWLRETMLTWRLALLVMTGLAIALFVMVAAKQVPTISTVRVAPPSRSENDLAPTIANYQMIASQSSEKLSDLLTQQGNKPLPPVPTYTVSSFDLANISN